MAGQKFVIDKPVLTYRPAGSDSFINASWLAAKTEMKPRRIMFGDTASGSSSPVTQPGITEASAAPSSQLVTAEHESRPAECESCRACRERQEAHEAAQKALRVLAAALRAEGTVFMPSTVEAILEAGRHFGLPEVVGLLALGPGERQALMQFRETPQLAAPPEE